VCFDFLYNFCMKQFSFWEQVSEIWSKMYIGLHIQYRLFLPDFNETWTFLTDFQKNTQTSYFVKYDVFIQWESSCSMWTDGHTDMTKVIVTISNFAYKPKNWYFKPLGVSSLLSCNAASLGRQLTVWGIVTFTWKYNQPVKTILHPVVNLPNKGSGIFSPETIWCPLFTQTWDISFI